jgi:hypothetical protein
VLVLGVPLLAVPTKRRQRRLVDCDRGDPGAVDYDVNMPS